MKVINKERVLDVKSQEPIVRLELEFNFADIQDINLYNKVIRDDLVKALGEELIRTILEK